MIFTGRKHRELWGAGTDVNSETRLRVTKAWCGRGFS